MTGPYGQTSLAGTDAANVIYTPGAMGDGNWMLGTHVEARASAEQRAGLEASSLARPTAKVVTASVAPPLRP